MIFFLGQVKEWTDNSGIVGYELLIEVGKAEGGIDFLDFGGGWPGSNAIKFDWVHGKLS